MKRRLAVGQACIRTVFQGLAIIAAGAAVFRAADAQGPPARQELPTTPRAAAPIDLTGYWVSIVNEDWRWRMITPAKGDVVGVPLSAKGRDVANGWNPATDGSCLAYGAAGIMRMPTRLRVTWENDTILKIETDAGQQVRRLVFAKSLPSGPRTLQGHSVAEWVRSVAGSGFLGIGPPGPPPPGGSLKVVTTGLLAGWLRKNGVPYSENTVVTEYFDRFPVPDGTEWFVVTTSVEDPTYLTGPFVTSSHFRREPDGSKWHPQACKAI
jgi:hypothetical protein